MSTSDTGANGDVASTEAADDRLAVASVLQELTALALELFDPSSAVDDFLHTVAARLGCRAVLCVEAEGDDPPVLCLRGAAGLARSSRSLLLPEGAPTLDLAIDSLPYREIDRPGLIRWVIASRGGPSLPRGERSRRLLLYFEREPRSPRLYKGMLERLAGHLGVALEHRRLYELHLASERALRVTSSQLRALIEHLPSGIIAEDENRVITHVNQALCRLLGLDIAAADMVGTPAAVAAEANMLLFADPRGFLARSEELVRGNDVVLDEQLELADGRVFERDCVPIVVDGARVGRCWTLRDVTRAYRASDEIKRLNENLERRVAERTRELAEKNVELALSLEALHDTQARLSVSDRMASIGTLAAGVAHEINNPLAYITANLALVSESLEGAPGAGRLGELGEMIAEARAGAEQVRWIVRGLKTFSRTEPERRAPIDVHRVLAMSINMAFNEIKHRARLEKELGQLPIVEADEARLGQLFINLLVNAAQAIQEGQADRNTIRVVTRTDSAGRAQIEVRDTGPGIPPDILHRVFDPFFTTKPVGVGTGLGLSICHGIVSALGGEITIESELGVGTTVRVALPPASEPVRGPSVRPIAALAAKRGRVLVVDDDPRIGVVLRRVLAEHDVTLANSGREALAVLAASDEFDLILSDLMMPEMSGIELYAEIGKVAPALTGRIVFLTGGAFTAAAETFLGEIPNEHLDKPFDMRTVRALVRRFVG